MPKVGLDRAKTGRKKGTPNKTTALLKDAIIMAAELTGNDGAGKDGLVGYCQYLAKEEPKSFATLMGRVLPMQIEGSGPNGEVVFQTVYEAAPK